MKTVLSNLGKHEANKVVDTEVLTTYCGTCSQRNHDNVLLSTIASSHECDVNHEGLAGKMEADGALRIFGNS